MTTTDRFTLPLLVAGQSQKEVTHNEALALLDMLVQPIVQSVAPSAIPPSPALGQCWIVGTGAPGAWSGFDGALACWTSGGWRFIPAQEGVCVWSLADSVIVRRSGARWIIGTENVNHLTVNNTQVVGAQQGPVASPIAGNTTDIEGRAAINAILGALRAHGLIAS